MKYKIAQISDCHLGYASGKKRIQGINKREIDGYNAYFEAIDCIIENKPDIALITGDLFHTPKPSMYCILQAQIGLRKLAENGIPVYILAGNHDSTDILSEVPSSKVVDEPNNNIFSYTEPYIVKEVKPGLYIHFVSHHGYIEQQKTMKEVSPVDNAFNILATHGSVYDSVHNMVLKSEQEPREIIIPEEILQKKWDYTLLGHIHTRGWVYSETNGMTDTANKKVFYGGSLIRRGFSDKECPLDRGVTLWSIDTEEKTMTPEFFNVWQRPQYDKVIEAKNKNVSEIEDEIYDLISVEKYVETEPIMRITINNLSNDKRLAINWKKFLVYQNNFLTFSFKIKEEKEDVSLKEKAKGKNFSSNIYEDFKAFYEDKDPEILNKILDFLKRGQDEVLEKN